jgi:hypothetical protein
MLNIQKKLKLAKSDLKFVIIAFEERAAKKF